MRRLITLGLLVAACLGVRADEPKPLKILFVGDEGHHRPAERYRQMIKPMADRKIDIQYAGDARAFNADTLAKYDGVIVYANIDNMTPEQEQALLDYVASGKGFIPLHCASYCFRNSSKYVELVGAQFQRRQVRSPCKGGAGEGGRAERGE